MPAAADVETSRRSRSWLDHIIILQNKIDLVKEAAAPASEDIKAFVKGTVADNSPIVPISAQLRYNIDVVAEYITNHIPVPLRDFTSQPKMIIIRSFDVNKPGEEVSDLRGGVAGGSILQGVLKLGQEIEIRPGIISRGANGTVKCVPLSRGSSRSSPRRTTCSTPCPAG